MSSSWRCRLCSEMRAAMAVLSSRIAGRCGTARVARCTAASVGSSRIFADPSCAEDAVDVRREGRGHYASIDTGSSFAAPGSVCPQPILPQPARTARRCRFAAGLEHDRDRCRELPLGEEGNNSLQTRMRRNTPSAKTQGRLMPALVGARSRLRDRTEHSFPRHQVSLFIRRRRPAVAARARRQVRRFGRTRPAVRDCRGSVHAWQHQASAA
jgi:hypothetical protein